MSMSNDIEWKTNDENCVSNAEKVKNHAMKCSKGQWTFLGPGSEEKWCGNSSYVQKKENGIPQSTKWLQRSEETVILCSEV